MKLPALSFGLLFLAACSGNIDWDKKFNRTDWTADEKGCLSRRIDYLDSILANKKLLNNLTEIEVRGVLGKPDFTDLAGRSQKFYRYYLTPGKQCDAALPKNGSYLQLRFNSINRVNEVSVVYE